MLKLRELRSCCWFVFWRVLHAGNALLCIRLTVGAMGGVSTDVYDCVSAKVVGEEVIMRRKTREGEAGRYQLLSHAHHLTALSEITERRKR